MYTKGYALSQLFDTQTKKPLQSIEIPTGWARKKGDLVVIIIAVSILEIF